MIDINICPICNEPLKQFISGNQQAKYCTYNCYTYNCYTNYSNTYCAGYFGVAIHPFLINNYIDEASYFNYLDDNIIDIAPFELSKEGVFEAIDFLKRIVRLGAFA
jgi:hypothetical protein